MMLLRRCPDGVGDGELGNDDESFYRSSDNSILKRRKSTGEFVVVHLNDKGTNGTIGTYMRPDKPSAHCNSQVGK